MSSLQTDPPVRLLVSFQQTFEPPVPQWIIKTPGREMWLAATLADSEQFTVVAPDLNARTTFSWQSAKNKRTLTNRPLPNWARYPAGVLVALCRAEMDIPGLEAVVAGEEPAGPRYEHALGMAFAALWNELHEQPYTTESLLEIVDAVRRDYLEA